MAPSLRSRRNANGPASTPAPTPVIASVKKSAAKVVLNKLATPIKTLTTKVPKTVASKQATTNGSEPEELNFSDFQITKVIDDSADFKKMVFLGLYKDKEAVLRLEKTGFNEKNTKVAICDKATIFRRDFVNDIYSSYIINPDSLLNEIKATVVWPATEAAITKYSRTEMVFFCETPDVYTKIVKPFIDSVVESDTDPNRWIYNILEGKTETERVILNDPDPDSGFMLIPDLKWLGDEKDLHYVAICHRRDIRSLRDLTDKHLVLLKNICMKGTKAIKDKYAMTSSHLRTFIHYQPQFYHFHVHFKLVDASNYMSSDRDNLLGTVINNITLKKDYYKKATLTYPLSKSHGLYRALKDADKVQ